MMLSEPDPCDDEDSYFDTPAEKKSQMMKIRIVYSATGYSLNTQEDLWVMCIICSR